MGGSIDDNPTTTWWLRLGRWKGY